MSSTSSLRLPLTPLQDRETKECANILYSDDFQSIPLSFRIKVAEELLNLAKQDYDKFLKSVQYIKLNAFTDDKTKLKNIIDYHDKYGVDLFTELFSHQPDSKIKQLREWLSSALSETLLLKSNFERDIV